MPPVPSLASLRWLPLPAGGAVPLLVILLLATTCCGGGFAQTLIPPNNNNWTSSVPSSDAFRSQLLSAVTASASVRAVITRQLESVRRALRITPPVPREPPPSTTELCGLSGHDTCELHVVPAGDGFLLSVVRIRAARAQAPARAPVMLLLHGILSSSDSWMMSWHEMGLYDLPAMMDYVLEKTGLDSLHLVGHSMATSAFLVTMSTRPEYNAKIRSAHLMAPVIRMRGLVRQVSDGVFGGSLFDLAQRWVETNKLYEIWPRLSMWHYIGDVFCMDNSPFIDVCYFVYEQILGKTNPEQRLSNFMALFGAYHTTGSSLRVMEHYGAINLDGKFRPLGKSVVDDQNPESEYNLSAISAPVALYYSLGDGIIDPKDVERVSNALPQVIMKYQVPMKAFNHVDFMWAKDVKKLVYDALISLASEIESASTENNV